MYKYFAYSIIILKFVHCCLGYPSSYSGLSPSNPDVDAFGVPIICVVRDFNFTATVTDRNGKKCRGLVQTKACFGSCESYEVGTFQFPWIVRVQPVCNYAEIVTRMVRLRDCEPGADRDAAFYRFPEAKSCACQTCDKKRQVCEPVPTPSPEGDQENNISQTENQGSSIQSASSNDYSNDEPAFASELLFGRLLTSSRRRRH